MRSYKYALGWAEISRLARSRRAERRQRVAVAAIVGWVVVWLTGIKLGWW